MRVFRFGLLAILLLAAQPAMAAQKRVALVMGNTVYERVGKLLNPAKDSRALARTLRRMGYEVTELHDLTRAKMRRAIVSFGHKARHADLALIYFAGHGIEVNGENWLLPVDARLRVDVDVEDEALALSYVMNKLRSTKRLGLVILDACRNNPFARQMTRSAFLTRAVKNGLARVEPRGNVLVAYAAREGTQAYDGAGAHSPYAAALIKHLPTKGLDVRLLFGRVRDAVQASTNGRQTPHIYGSLGGKEIPLVAGKSKRRATGRFDARALDLAFWKGIEHSKDPADFADYLVQFPRGVFARRARRLQKKYEKRVAVGIYPERPDPSLDRLPYEPEVVHIPGGTFIMGCVSGKDCYDSEKPVHRVTVGSFYLSKYETTFAQYDACVKDGGCKHKPGDEGWGRGNRPVINVSWHDAVAYAKWLSRKTGQTWRLPTEAEWKYAARAGSETKYSWGNSIDCSKANYGNGWDESCKSVNPGKTKAVGSFSANQFGLHDMHGNVWEWVYDRYGSYKSGHQTDPQGPRNGSYRVFRGGGWGSFAGRLRSASRSNFLPVNRFNYLGFRLLRQPS